VSLTGALEDGSPRVGQALDRDRQLTAVLVEFARTQVTDFPIQAILDHLVERIVDVLPITAAGVTLISPGVNPYYIAASNDAALEFEQLQSSTGKGPCTEASTSGLAVSVPDLRVGDHRFAEFCAAASAAGLAAVFTLPLRHDSGQLGALDLYRDTPGPLTDQDLAAAQTLADVATAYLLNAQARQALLEGADQLRASTLHDALTGLPNRVLLQQRLQHAAERAHRTHAPVAVLFADLDRFKQVNDTYGHPVGDALLVAVSDRLTGLLRPGDTLARVSGDEFVILCEDLKDAADVQTLAYRIDSAFSVPFTVPDADRGSRALTVTASIGMAFAGQSHDIGPSLIRDADTAMYQAKRKGGDGHQVIDLREAGAAADRRHLQDDLRATLDNDALAVAYQPVVRAADGLLIGVEALLRWHHPNRGLIPAETAVALAEHSPLILDLGAWVLQRCCQEWTAWQRHHRGRALDLAVNVSASQFMAPGFGRLVAGVLSSTGMDPSRLVLEVTESIFLEDGSRATHVMAALKDLGVRLALDDFGTGYSSLSYLRRVPVDIIKIDQSFVTGLGPDPAGAAIVAAIAELAHALGLTVVAEGVETAQQRDAVVSIGCEAAQGFHYARPLTGDQLDKLLEDWGDIPVHLPLQPPPEDLAPATT